MRKHLGFALLAVSYAPWAVFASLPLFDLPKGEAVLVATGVFIAGQIAFVGGLVLLGNTVWERIKARHARCRNRS
jgi:hypothetical protein